MLPLLVILLVTTAGLTTGNRYRGILDFDEINFNSRQYARRPPIVKETIIEEFSIEPRHNQRPSPIKEKRIEEFKVQPRHHVRPSPVKKIIEEFNLQSRHHIRPSPTVKEIVIDEYRPNFRKSVPQLHPELLKICVEKVPVAPCYEGLVAHRNHEPASHRLSPHKPGVLPYCSAQLIFDKEANIHLNQLNFSTPTARSFASIFLVIQTLAKGISEGLSYDAAYNTEAILLAVAELVPEATRDIVVKNLLNALKALDPIRKLVYKNLNHRVEQGCERDSIDANELSECDRRVDAIVRNNRQYQDVAALVIGFGQQALLYQARSAEINAAASTQTEQQYLANSKATLKPFILRLAANLRITNHLNPVQRRPQ